MTTEPPDLSITRVFDAPEVRQWLPAHVTRATEAGWRQSFAELDALLAKRAVA